MTTLTYKIEHTSRRWNYPIQASMEASFEFSTPEKLEKLLNNDTNWFTVGWKDYFTNFHKVLRSWVNPSLTLQLKIEGDQPDFLEKSLRHIARNHSNIGSISIEGRSDEDELITRLKAVIEARDKEAYRRYRKIRLAVAVPTVIGSISLALGMAPLAAAYFVIKESFIGASILSLRQWYLDSAAKHFSKKEQINNTTDHRVITALEKGTRSVGWGHYFLSHFSYSAWKHPRVFAAGMELALEGKQKHVDLIHEKYANRMS